MQLLPNKRTVDRAAATTGGSSTSKGMELAVGLVVFAGIGWLLDRAFGTMPWFTISLFVFAVIGNFARLWYSYDAEMKDHEQRVLDRRGR